MKSSAVCLVATLQTSLAIVMSHIQTLGVLNWSDADSEPQDAPKKFTKRHQKALKKTLRLQKAGFNLL